MNTRLVWLMVSVPNDQAPVTLYVLTVWQGWRFVAAPICIVAVGK